MSLLEESVSLNQATGESNHENIHCSQGNEGSPSMKAIKWFESKSRASTFKLKNTEEVNVFLFKETNIFTLNLNNSSINRFSTG